MPWNNDTYTPSKDTVNGKEIMSITVTLEDGTKVTIDHKTKKELLMYIGKM